MADTKRKYIHESIESSEDENLPRSAKRNKKIEIVDLSQSDSEVEDDDGNVANAARAAAQNSLRSLSIIEKEEQAAGQPSMPLKSHTPAESEAPSYKSPFEFHERPPFWEKWSTDEFSTLIQDLVSQFGMTARTLPFIQHQEANNPTDPRQFSRQIGKPQEEILHVLSALVSKPLQNVIKASKSGELDLQRTVKGLERLGSGRRNWNGGNVVGEIQRIRTGAVFLVVMPDARDRDVRFADLREEDLEFLEKKFDERYRIVPYDCGVEDGSDEEVEDAEEEEGSAEEVEDGAPEEDEAEI